MPLRRRVDAGLAVASSLDSAEQDALRSLRVQLAVVGGPVPGFSRVGVDDRAGAVMAVRHLVLLGHRDIVMISGEPADPVGRATTAARRAGFEAALAEAGIGGADRVIAEPWGVSGGMRAVEQLLARRTLPTAIFAESDEMALGALQVLRRAGLDVPGRISLVGFDDHEMAPAGDLTTIAQPVRRQGELAAGWLLSVLAGREQDGPVELVLPTRLVVRGTTGPPAPALRAGSAFA
jgi:DNA-binding LacI/PurR family transcriptional regulator